MMHIGLAVVGSCSLQARLGKPTLIWQLRAMCVCAAADCTQHRRPQHSFMHFRRHPQWCCAQGRAEGLHAGAVLHSLISLCRTNLRRRSGPRQCHSNDYLTPIGVSPINHNSAVLIARFSHMQACLAPTCWLCMKTNRRLTRPSASLARASVKSSWCSWPTAYGRQS